MAAPNTNLFAGVDFDAEAVKSDTWMITFADLMALMVAFFVLIFSMSDLEPKEWSDVVTSLADGIAPQAMYSSESSAAPGISIDHDEMRTPRAGYLETLLTAKFEPEIEKGTISVDSDGSTVIFSVHRSLIGSGDISAPKDTEQRGAVQSIASALSSLRDPVEMIVVGRAAEENGYQSTLEETLLGGHDVLKILTDAGLDRRIRVYASVAISEQGTSARIGGQMQDQILFYVRTGQ